MGAGREPQGRPLWAAGQALGRQSCGPTDFRPAETPPCLPVHVGHGKPHRVRSQRPVACFSRGVKLSSEAWFAESARQHREAWQRCQRWSDLCRAKTLAAPSQTASIVARAPLPRGTGWEWWGLGCWGNVLRGLQLQGVPGGRERSFRSKLKRRGHSQRGAYPRLCHALALPARARRDSEQCKLSPRLLWLALLSCGRAALDTSRESDDDSKETPVRRGLDAPKGKLAGR